MLTHKAVYPSPIGQMMAHAKLQPLNNVGNFAHPILARKADLALSKFQVSIVNEMLTLKPNDCTPIPEE